MTQLLETYHLLVTGLNQDPLLCLAHAATLLDPFRSELLSDELEDDWYYSVEASLDILRRAFPDIYAQAVVACHQGAAYEELDRLICSEMTARGIPLDTVEGMAYGVPLPAYGVALHDPDFYSYHPELLPALQLLGIETGDNYPIAIPDHLYTIAHHLMTSLTEHPDERYQQIGWLMGWLGSSTNNTVCDVDWEGLAGYQPLSWEPDDLAFAIAIIEEAEEIMESVRAGLQLFEANATIRAALKHNIQRLHRSLAQPSKNKKERKKHVLRLHWPSLDDGLNRTTEPDD